MVYVDDIWNGIYTELLSRNPASNPRALIDTLINIMSYGNVVSLKNTYFMSSRDTFMFIMTLYVAIRKIIGFLRTYQTNDI